MPKKEPITLSTTHFVFCAQSFRNWLRKLMHRDEKSMAIKFKFGKPPIFGKMCFWPMGKVNSQKWDPTHYSFMSFISSRSWGLLSSLLHVFCNYLHCHGWETPFLVLLSKFAAKIHDLGVLRGHFCLLHAAGACCAFPSRFLCRFIILSMPINSFLVLLNA